MKLMRIILSIALLMSIVCTTATGTAAHAQKRKAIQATKIDTLTTADGLRIPINKDEWFEIEKNDSIIIDGRNVYYRPKSFGRPKAFGGTAVAKREIILATKSVEVSGKAIKLAGKLSKECYPVRVYNHENGRSIELASATDTVNLSEALNIVLPSVVRDSSDIATVSGLLRIQPTGKIPCYISYAITSQVRPVEHASSPTLHPNRQAKILPACGILILLLVLVFVLWRISKGKSVRALDTIVVGKKVKAQKITRKSYNNGINYNMILCNKNNEYAEYFYQIVRFDSSRYDENQLKEFLKDKYHKKFNKLDDEFITSVYDVYRKERDGIITILVPLVIMQKDKSCSGYEFESECIDDKYIVYRLPDIELNPKDQQENRQESEATQDAQETTATQDQTAPQSTEKVDVSDQIARIEEAKRPLLAEIDNLKAKLEESNAAVDKEKKTAKNEKASLNNKIGELERQNTSLNKSNADLNDKLRLETDKRKDEEKKVEILNSELKLFRTSLMQFPQVRPVAEKLNHMLTAISDFECRTSIIASAIYANVNESVAGNFAKGLAEVINEYVKVKNSFPTFHDTQVQMSLLAMTGYCSTGSDLARTLESQGDASKQGEDLLYDTYVNFNKLISATLTAVKNIEAAAILACVNADMVNEFIRLDREIVDDIKSVGYMVVDIDMFTKFTNRPDIEADIFSQISGYDGDIITGVTSMAVNFGTTQSKTLVKINRP